MYVTNIIVYVMPETQNLYLLVSSLLPALHSNHSTVILKYFRGNVSYQLKIVTFHT